MEELEQIKLAIIKVLESNLHLIGNVIVEGAEDEALKQGIYDRGDFHDNMIYRVESSENSMSLRVGSNTPHEPYVIGGKVPSWTPLEPLKGWVERKNLDWTDKDTGKALTVDQMARMIQWKIKREGIKARNVFETVISNKEEWIIEKLTTIEL
jgi:hypothetical protein